MSLAGRAHELREQGAMEASRDPNSSVSAKDAERVVMEQARKAGSAAYSFDPNASPEEKARQAAAAVPPGFHHERKPKAVALVSDQDDDGSAPQYDLPSPSTAGALAPPTPTANGTATGKVEEEGEWDRVGWAPRFGNPAEKEMDTTTLLDHQTWVEGQLSETLYGDWYHNTGVIIFACLATYVVTLLGGGLAWVVIVMTFCGTYYRTSIRRVRRNFKDDINRQMAKARLETDTESLEWINSFLVKFWPIYAPVLCKTIVASVDQVLSTSKPAFLDSLRLTHFVLGTKPPRLEHVKTYPRADDDIVLMDWKFSFTPADTSDLTARQIKVMENPKIILEVRIGKGVVSKGLDVIVENMAFSGMMRVKMKLQIPFPHIDRVDISFIGKPTIDYVCKPLGGEHFGFDINFIPGLESFIMEQIHANLGPMMYDPNVFPIEIAKILAGTPVDQAVGVLQITFHGAQGLRNPDKLGTPDPYAVVSVNNRVQLAKTKTVHETANPRWNETVNVILTSFKDTLTIQTFDYNEYRKDKDLGTASWALEQLESGDYEHENLQLEVMANGRPRGVVQADIRFFPVLEGAIVDGVPQPPPESLTGIAKFTIEAAKELDGSKSMIGQLSPYAVLLLNGKEVQISTKLKRTNNPVFPDATKELLITNRKQAKLGVVLKDDRGLTTDPILGTYQIKLDDLIDCTEKGQEWFNLAGTQTGRVKMAVQWKPVALKGALAGSGGYITPIGVMRLHFINARDLLNVESFAGKSDPYTRVLVSSVEKGRTVTFKNNLNPDFDEVLYVPVHSIRERLTLEVMDSENVGKDRSLGHIELPVSDFAKQDDNGEWLVNENRSPVTEALRISQKGQKKGTLTYTASFYPTYNVIDPEDEKEAEEKRVNGEKRPSNATSAISDDAQKALGLPERERAGTISSLRPSISTNGDAAAKALAEGEKEQEQVVHTKREPPKIRVTADNVHEYESGLLVFRLLEGQFSRDDVHLEVVMDDYAFPAHVTSKIRSKNAKINEVGDAMVRELDISKITLQLVDEVDKKGEGKDDRVKAKLAGNTIDVLRRCLYNPTQLTLKDKDGRESTVTVSLRYIPVKMTLDPSESINNMGILRVDVLDAADLPSADRDGYSDPYCRFVLNGKEVFKTKTQKKTLHPAWNEFFEVQVQSRTAAKFQVVVYDWDFGEKEGDLLGKADINLEMLDPFRPAEVSLGLDGKSGTIRLKMLFKPDYVTRSRQGSSTFSGTFAAPGKIVGAPVKGVGKGAVFVGGGVVKGASFLGKTFKRNKAKDEREEFIEAGNTINGAAIPDSPESPRSPEVLIDSSAAPSTFTTDRPSTAGAAPLTPATSHSRHRSYGAQSLSSGFGASPAGAESGTAHITVASAHGFQPDTNLRCYIKMRTPRGDKEVYKSKAVKTNTGDAAFENEETAKVKCNADSQFSLLVYDHSTFGRDELLGQGTFFLNDQGGSGGETTVTVGNGTVVVRSRFEESDKASMLQASPAHKEGGRGLRSFMGTRRVSQDVRRQGTPEA